MQIEYKQINAFTDGSSSGNPAGYVFDHYQLTDMQMQQLATELAGAVSEVVYLKNGKGEIDYTLRYFSQEREVAFCGHGTLAVMNHEIQNNSDISTKKAIKIATTKGILDIINDYSENIIYIHAPEPEYIQSNLSIAELCSALNIYESSLNLEKPLEIINGGLNTLIIPFMSAENVIECKPEYFFIRDFCINNNCDIIIIFSEDTINSANNYRTRVFAPTFGYLEDPATGSGNSALGYYLNKHRLWNNNKIIIEQGTSPANPNIIYLKHSPDIPGRIMFGGKSIVKLAGIYDL